MITEGKLKKNRRRMRFEKGRTPHGAKPFRKGQSGNPNGRPKDNSITGHLQRELCKEVRMAIGRNKKGHLIFQSMPAAEAIARRVIHALLYAKKLSVPLLDLVMYRTEGPPPSREDIMKRENAKQILDYSVLTDKEFREYRRLQRKMLDAQAEPIQIGMRMAERNSEPYYQDIEYKIMGQIPEKII